MKFFIYCILVLFGISMAGQTNKDSVKSNEDAVEIEMVDDSGATTQQSRDTLAAIDTMPALLTFVQADYPSDLIKKGVEGTVLLELLVNETGGVDSARVVKGLQARLDSSAVTAARQFKFSPAKAGGAAVAVLLQYEYRFTLAMAADSIAQFVNFSGQLLEKGTRKPVPDAMVVLTFPDTIHDTTLPMPFSKYLQRIGTISGQSLEEGKIVTTTDSTGHFKFYSLPAGLVEISIPTPGYEVYETEERTSRNEELVVKYYQKRVSYSDYEITVYGKAEEKEVARRTLSVQEIKKIPGFGGDAVKVIQAMPGVARPMFGMGDVIVRGAPTWDSQFSLDGIFLPTLYHFGGLKSTYNSNALQEIEFYPGGFGTRYGGSIAGAIELTGREAKKDRWHGMADISTIDGSVMAEGPVTKDISILASCRRSFIGEIINQVTKNVKDFPASLLPYYWDYIGRTDWKISKNQSAFLTLFGSLDSIRVIIPQMQEGSEEISKQADQLSMRTLFNMGILGWDFTPNDYWKNSLRYGLIGYKTRSSIFGFTSWKQSEIVNQIRDQLTYTFNDHNKINVGADVALASVDYNLAIPQGNNAIMMDTVNNWTFGVVGGYLNYEWKPFDKVLIIPGLRYDYYPELKYDGSIVPAFWNYSIINNHRGISGEPSFRINGRYEFIKNHTLKAAVGNYSQSPQPMGQTIDKQWGDPTMPATKAAHYVGGYEWKITDLINLDVQSYFNNQFDIPVQVSSDALDPDNPTALWHNNGRGRMYGMEVMLRHLQSEHFFGWIAYTLSRSERYNPEKKKWQIYDQDEIHNLQVLGSFKLPKEWEAGFRLRYVSGKPTTPVIGRYFNENYDGFVPIYGDFNSDRFDPFFQLDLRVDKKFVFDKFMYSFYVDFQDASYFIYKSPEMDIYNYDYTDKTRISMIPMVAVGASFEF